MTTGSAQLLTCLTRSRTAHGWAFGWHPIRPAWRPDERAHAFTLHRLMVHVDRERGNSVLVGIRWAARLRRPWPAALYNGEDFLTRYAQVRFYLGPVSVMVKVGHGRTVPHAKRPRRAA